MSTLERSRPVILKYIVGWRPVSKQTQRMGWRRRDRKEEGERVGVGREGDKKNKLVLCAVDISSWYLKVGG